MSDTLAIKAINTDNFYNDPNSIYIKLTYCPKINSFKFEVKNCLIEQFTPETVPEHVLGLTNLVKGMVAVSIDNAGEMRRIGETIYNAEILENTDMEEKHKNLLRGNMKGNA